MIIPVNLDEKYDVIVENGALDDVEKHLNLNRKVLVLTDDGVPEKYAEKIAKKCETPVAEWQWRSYPFLHVPTTVS